MRWVQTAWYWAVRNFVRVVLFHCGGGFRVYHKERVPKNGALIVAPNHVSYLDPPAVSCAIPRRLSFMAKAELFRFSAFGWLISSLGSFPVKRGSGDRESIKIAISILEQEKALIMFPEGTRGFDEHLLPFNKGVNLLAKKSRAGVLPVGIVGTHRRWAKHSKKFRFGPVKVLFGDPIYYHELVVAEGEDRDEVFLAELRARIHALCVEGGSKVKISESSSGSTAESHPDSTP